MQLTHQQFHAYAIGLSSSSTVDGAWHPLRTPDSMVPLYEKTVGFKVRMHCASCVRIRFNSNTHSIKIMLKFDVRAREVFKSALIVDDHPPIPFGPENFNPTWAGEIFHQPSPGTRTFDIWLPHMAQADIISLEIDDGATLSPAPALKFHWLAYGDSITQGMTATLPTQTAIARTAIALNANVLNLGIGGAELDQALHLTVPPGHYDIISIAYGTNDFAHNVPIEIHLKYVKLLLTALTQKHPGTPIILITPLTWVGNTAPNKIGYTLDQMRQALVPIASEFKQVTLLPGDQLIPDNDKYFVDKVHPNSEGFSLYASTLTAALQKTLAAK